MKAFNGKAQVSVSDKRLLTEIEGAAYSGIGRTAFRVWAKEIGARRTFGRSVRYDKNVIDRALDEMQRGGIDP